MEISRRMERGSDESGRLFPSAKTVVICPLMANPSGDGSAAVPRMADCIRSGPRAQLFENVRRQR